MAGIKAAQDPSADRRIFSLHEVARSIQRTISERYGNVYWVKAEMNKLNHYSHSGHCFPELLEKKDGQVVTEMRAVLWKTDFQRVNHLFINTIREPLKDGIMILFQATIQYDPLYGLSLKILDIDPSYSLGQLERERQESIDRLKKEQIYFHNKQLPFPLVPKRLAIISVETSKGYSDFLQIIENNPWKYHFEMSLFPALLQGDRSVGSIVTQLDRIRQMTSDFDVVLIIRGGGGEVGLSSYNQYTLAAAIASFPLPVMTGIGHSTNQTVSEMVAYQSAITPSELADFLIQHFHNFAEPVREAQRIIGEKVPQLIEKQQQELERMGNRIQLVVQQKIATEKQRVLQSEWSIKSQVSILLQNQKHQLKEVAQLLVRTGGTWIRDHHNRLENLEKQLELMDPIHILKRGFSITTLNGKAVLDIRNIQEGVIIKTQIAGGLIESTVTHATAVAEQSGQEEQSE